MIRKPITGKINYYKIVSLLCLIILLIYNLMATKPELNTVPEIIFISLYDNSKYLEKVKTKNKNILFDTDADSEILLGNMQSIGIEPNYIPKIVPSHSHQDHIGRLTEFLKHNTKYCNNFLELGVGKFINIK